MPIPGKELEFSKCARVFEKAQHKRGGSGGGGDRGNGLKAEMEPEDRRAETPVPLRVLWRSRKNTSVGQSFQNPLQACEFSDSEVKFRLA